MPTDDENKPKLFDLPPTWAPKWEGMPDYKQEDLQPWQTVKVHFSTVEDRAAFSKLMGQQLTDLTKFLWFPPQTIEQVRNKRYVASKPILPTYPIYIISKGRWETRLTSKALEVMNVPYRIVVEPQEFDQYASVIHKEKILVLPFSNLGQGSIPARNWVWEHSLKNGDKRHWILDDNISGWGRLHENMKIQVHSGIVFRALEDFADRYLNLGLAGHQYDYFAKRKFKWTPFVLNTRIYSSILVLNSLPFRWRGRYNEDTDLSLNILKQGFCTALFNAFLCYKAPTLTMKGGNADSLYKGEGRKEMAEALQAQHPDVVKVVWRWSRWQHIVDYTGFKKNKLIEDPKAVIDPNASKYDMEIEIIPEAEKPAQEKRPEEVKEKKPEAAAVVEAKPEPAVKPEPVEDLDRYVSPFDKAYPLNKESTYEFPGKKAIADQLDNKVEQPVPEADPSADLPQADFLAEELPPKKPDPAENEPKVESSIGL